MNIDSTKKNFLFQTLYQVLILVIPLIISPYLTRTLGSESLGTYSYVNSVAYYFLLVANLGIAKHGQRVIANNRDDQIQVRKSFWSLFVVHEIISIVSIIAYFACAIFFFNEDKNNYLLQGIYVISALFDITWLFYGLENFKSVVIKNGLIKVFECVLIFVFIHNSTDLWIYTFIMSASILLGQLVMIPQAIALIKPIKIDWNDCKVHLKPLLILFISVIASTLYTVFDKTLLGLLSTKNDVAYYEYANRIITIPKQLLLVICTVFFPKACKAYSENRFNDQKEYIDISMFITCFMGSAFTYGLMAIGQKFAILYYGQDFETSGQVIILMSPLILIVMIGEVLRSEYLIPANKDVLYTISISVSAIVNIILSLILIRLIGIYGAIIGTTAAEIICLIFQIIVSKKLYPIKSILKFLIPFLIVGAIMFGTIYLIDINTDTSFLWLILEILIGAIEYTIISMLIIFVLYRKQWNMLKKSLFKKKIKERE